MRKILRESLDFVPMR